MSKTKAVTPEDGWIIAFIEAANRQAKRESDSASRKAEPVKPMAPVAPEPFVCPEGLESLSWIA